MIRFLVLIQMLDFVRSNIARPLHIEEVSVVGFEHVEASCFARVDNSVVDVGRV